MKIKEVWDNLLSRHDFPDIKCWWLRHNEDSNVLIICNKGNHGLLNTGIKIWCLSVSNFSTILPKLRADSTKEVILDELSQWNKKPKHDAVAFIELTHGSKTFCFKNLSGKLIATTQSLEHIVHSLTVRLDDLS